MISVRLLSKIDDRASSVFGDLSPAFLALHVSSSAWPTKSQRQESHMMIRYARRSGIVHVKEHGLICSE